MKRVAIACLLAGCEPTPPPPVYVSATAAVSEPEPPPQGGDRVIVLTDKRVARPTEVIGVLDFHTDALDPEKGFGELRARAAAMGAEAVLGAEFEHGEGGGPSHLSGIAVRFLDH